MSPVDEIYARRRKRLKEVIRQFFDGKQVRLAEKLGKQPDYVSRMLGGTKNIGEDSVRDIEHALQKHAGWFDEITKPSALSPNTPLPPREQMLLESFRNSDEPIKQAAEAVLKSPFSPPSVERRSKSQRI